MNTHGKKKRGIMLSLNSFSSLRGSNATTKSKNEKGIKVPIPTASMDQGNGGLIRATSDRDWIEDDASLLLNEATKVDHKGISTMSIDDSYPALLQLPPIIFHNDKSLMGPNLDVDSSSSQYSSGSAGSAKRPAGKVFRTGSRHSRKGSAPVIPRRSSKRRSAVSRQPLTRSQVSAPILLNQNDRNLTLQADYYSSVDECSILPEKNIALEVQDRITKMQSFTNTLKPPGNEDARSRSFSKKAGYKVNVLATKVKTAFNDQKQSIGAKRRHKNGMLLDSSAISEEDLLSNAEIRLNEGNNWVEKQKLIRLTGNGTVTRKPVANDGISLKSRKSFASLRTSDDIFTSQRLTRTPTSLLRDDSSSVAHSDEIVPDLPRMPADKSLSRKACSYVPQQNYFDAFLSSSPVAQSTPRIRLEPRFERDGKTTLKNVPADSGSLFDPKNSNYSDMELDAPAYAKHLPSDHIKRKSSQIKEPSQETVDAKRQKPVQPTSRSYHATKKHPSPTREYLFDLQNYIDNNPNFFELPTLPRCDNLDATAPVKKAGIGGILLDKSKSTTAINTKRAGGILVQKDINLKLSDSLSTNNLHLSEATSIDAGKLPESSNKRHDRGRGFGFLLKPTGLRRSAATLPDVLKSAVKLPKPFVDTKAGHGTSKTKRMCQQDQLRPEESDAEDSRLDIDELQWDQTALLGKRDWRECNHETRRRD